MLLQIHKTLNRKKSRFLFLAKKSNFPIITANCCFVRAPKLPLMGPKWTLTGPKWLLIVAKFPLTLMAI